MIEKRDESLKLSGWLMDEYSARTGITDPFGYLFFIFHSYFNGSRLQAP